MHMHKIVSLNNRPESEAEERSQDERRVLREVSDLANAMPLQSKAKNSDSVNDFPPRFILTLSKAYDVNSYTFRDHGFCGKARPRIGGIVGKE